MDEFSLIERLSRGLPGNATVVAGAGDDCAVLDVGVPGHFLLFKTDAVVEGIHFTKDTPAEKVGRKALARCLSDVAAMAGTPTHAVVTIGLPGGFDPEHVERVYSGLNEMAARYGVAVVGGETTSNPERLFISVALLGTVPRDKAVFRSGAKPGDALFVTGELGGSIMGKHLDFEPRLVEARWLAGNFAVHAMIDLSDGLAGDLRHILKRSGVGAELVSANIPISRAAKLRSRMHTNAKPPLLAALTDGEDFELLLAVSRKDAVPLRDAWKKKFPNLKLTCIGVITAEPGLRIRDQRGIRELEVHGYVHFA